MYKCLIYQRVELILGYGPAIQKYDILSNKYYKNFAKEKRIKIKRKERSIKRYQTGGWHC
jgi:hypothetical protein